MNRCYMTSFVCASFMLTSMQITFQMHSAGASRTKLSEQSVPAEAK